ncbi:uncharacterized protein LOC141680540 [Apium graveolens]|uniref:uncharacterized protein LOC141680540 n=1 Tax=Apium graveolens TaxID=4045 RepID=UPI003D7919F6
MKERYDHQKTIILPKARYDGLQLRLQDFKTVSEYNSTMFNITSQLKLRSENIFDNDMLEKTYSTFHANNMLLQQQYREREYTKYSELISILLLAMQNNELLMKNYQAHSTGSAPFSEVNVITSNEYEQNKQFGCGHGRGFGRGRARGRGFGRGQGHDHRKFSNFKNSHHQKWTKNEEKPKGSIMDKSIERTCHHCRIKVHWGRTCRISKHLVDLYQTSLKGVETKFTEQIDPLGITHLEAHLGGGIKSIQSALLIWKWLTYLKMEIWKWSNLVEMMLILIK